MWAKRATKPIPPIGSRQQTIEINDYSKGFNSFLANDKVPVKDNDANVWRLAQNARITTLGEYGTRKGFDYHSAPAGETQDDSQTTATGAADQPFNAVDRLAQKFTTSSAGRLTRIDVQLKNNSSALGTVLIELWTNVAGEPGALVSRSSIDASTITSSYTYLTARFADAPLLTTTTDYWVVAYVQLSASNSYKWSSTTAATDALTSSDSGSTWVASSFALNFKQYYSTSGGTKGFHRAYKSDNTSVTLLVQGTTLYSVNNTTGALTSVKTGLSSAATHYEFVTVNDTVYYVNEYDGLRKWDFTIESQVTATNYSLITEHKGLLFLLETLDKNKVIFSNFAAYETFTSTDFVYVPSPKTGDPVVSFESLNGYLIVTTTDNKYILSGSDNATFSLDEAPDKKGTYSQRTTTTDKNFMYYLSDDGVYRSNGSEAQLLSESVYQDIYDLQNKEEAVICVSKGRLYLWGQSQAASANNVCFVWNLNYGSGGSDVIESYDTGAYVSYATSAYRDDDALMVASPFVGQVFWQELPSNDYTNLGGDIDFLLQTHYLVGLSPAVLKEYRYWQPRFEAQSSSYVINCEYATDLRNNWELYSNPNVQGSGIIYGSGATYGGGEVYGTTAEVQEQLYIPGEHRRTAVRYKHYATRQPHTFLGHSFVVQNRRMR